MKIITCASYYGSGSSALTDLVSEYDSVKDLSDFEFRFLHDMDGVRDLEYYLTQNHNRHNSGHAIKRFAKLSKFNFGNFLSRKYSGYFEGNDYQRITQEYIEGLTDFKYNGWWFYDLYDKGTGVYYIYQAFNHIFRKLHTDSIRILKNEWTYCSHPDSQKFLDMTKAYVSRLMRALNKEGKEYLEIDQIVPSSNLKDILRYFDDEIFVFVVDRDPRDVFLSEKYYWKERICPSDAGLFCKWFAYAREEGNSISEDLPNVFKIHFEDLIYKYDETVEFIEKVTGLRPGSHIWKFEKLNPKRSVVNTRLWEKHSDKGDIRIIEKRLEKYLYSYDDTDCMNIAGADVKNSKVF